LLVHIGDPSSNQATTLESQMIHMIQVLSGQTLRLSQLHFIVRLGRLAQQFLHRPQCVFVNARIHSRSPE
jgi:hypothetical protein